MPVLKAPSASLKVVDILRGPLATLGVRVRDCRCLGLGAKVSSERLLEDAEH